jgi:putative nucleotidyltransferase with HDIG domain
MQMKEALDVAESIIMNDSLLYQHCINVATISYYAAKKLGLDQEKAFVGGLLHDMGKLGYVKITMANGPSAVAFMDHPVIGYGMLKDVDEEAAIMAYTHHLYQGTKYPDKVEIEIPKELEPYCQLIAYVDKIEAFMTRSHYSAHRARDTVDRFYPFIPGISQAVYDVVSNYSVVRLT